MNNQSFFIIHSSANFVVVFITFKFKKLLDIFKYKKNKDWLNAWKQSLIQRMNMNDDCYFFHWIKIIYIESWFIINKKTHNLMNQYWVNDFCIIFIFTDWWYKLHHYYDNSFKTENAYLYFHKTLKQEMNNFVDYYNSFY